VGKRLIAGIDQGTTGTRTNIYDESGALLATAYVPSRTTHPHTGWDEQDPMALLDAIETTLTEALRGVPGGELAAIGLANQGESIVAFDRKTGDPLTPAIIWSDRRAGEEAEAIRGTRAQETLEELTGLPLDSYFPSAKIAWLHRHVDAVRDAASRGRLAVGTLDSFFISRLTEGRVFASDPSTACRTQLANLSTRRFDEACAAAYELTLDGLPDVIPTVLPEGLQTTLGAPLTATVVDQMGALAAIGATELGELKVTYGTGCFIEANAGPTRPAPSPGLLAICAWDFQPEGVAYAVEGGVFTAATAVNWLVSVGVAADVAEVDALAEGRAWSETLFLPAFSGLAAPWWRPDATGVLSGLRSSTQREQLVVAVLEGIAHRVADILEAISVSQALPEVVRVDGGLSASRPLLQLQADLLGRPVVPSRERETTAAGAAGLATIGLGTIDLPGLAARAQFGDPVEPSVSNDERLERRERWRGFVEATAGLESA
jgi:glycerol kinase